MKSLHNLILFRVFFGVCPLLFGLGHSSQASTLCLSQIHQVLGQKIKVDAPNESLAAILSIPISELGIEGEIVRMKKELDEFLIDIQEIRRAKADLDEAMFPGPLDIYQASHPNRENRLKAIVDKRKWIGSQILPSNPSNPKSQFRYQPTWPERYRMLMDLDPEHLNFAHRILIQPVNNLGDAMDFAYGYILVSGFGLSRPVHSFLYKDDALVREFRKLIKGHYEKKSLLPWFFDSADSEKLPLHQCHRDDSCSPLGLIQLALSKPGEIPSSDQESPFSIWKGVSFGTHERNVLYPGIQGPSEAFWRSLEQFQE